MLQVQTFFNADELVRLNNEGELPPIDVVGKARRYMEVEGCILILLRDPSSWDVCGVFVDRPTDGDRLNRTLFTIFSDIEKIDPDLFRHHLRKNHFQSAMLHLPNTSILEGMMAVWRVMRHRKQAVGTLEIFKMQVSKRIAKDEATLAAHGETSRLEVHVSYPVRKADKDVCKRLTKYGFVTRKYIYHVTP